MTGYICVLFTLLILSGMLIAMLPNLIVLAGIEYLIGPLSEFHIIVISLWWGAIVGILLIRHCMTKIDEQVFRRQVDLSSKLLEDKHYPRKRDKLLKKVKARMNDSLYPLTMGLKFPASFIIFVWIMAKSPQWIINNGVFSMPHDHESAIFIPMLLGVITGTLLAGWYYHQPEIVMSAQEKTFLKHVENVADSNLVKLPSTSQNT